MYVETLEFERSMLFKRGKRPEYANDDKYLAYNVDYSRRSNKSMRMIQI
jgi:hypothetical protein